MNWVLPTKFTERRRTSSASQTPLDIKKIRGDFPILLRHVNGKPLVYLDNASTTQKPEEVIEAEANYYRIMNANIHRGIHTLAQEATSSYEGVRKQVARFINAKSPEEIIFTRSTTEAINIVAQAWGRVNLKEGDEVLVTEMEHHSNIVPWLAIAKERGATVRFWPITDDGRLVAGGGWKISSHPKIVAITHVSNVLGTANPIEEIVQEAHTRGALVLLDAAQSAAHLPLDIQKLQVDFLAFSAHKMYGPTGAGVLWARRELLQIMPPFQFGSDMIKTVTKKGATWNDLPWKFEAGTQDIAGVIGLGAALEYLSKVGMENITLHEEVLTEYALLKIAQVSGIRVLGPLDMTDRIGVISFLLGDVHPHDLATVLDEEGIAVRSGHHCAQPLMDRLGVPATARVSFALYNTADEVDRLIEALTKARKTFRL